MRNFLSPSVILTVVFTAVIFLTSCQKDPDETPPACQKTMSGLSGTYTMVSMRYKQTPSSAEQDWLPLIPACERDNSFKLLASGVYEETEAGLACSPSSAETGTWSLSGTTIISDGEIAGSIESYDCQKLVVSTPDVLITGDKVILTLQKQ